MEIARSDGLEFLSIPDLVQRALCSICADRQPGDTLPPKPSAVVASNPNECHHTLAAEVSRRKKAEHQAKQITAAMEEAGPGGPRQHRPGPRYTDSAGCLYTAHRGCRRYRRQQMAAAAPPSG